LFGVLWSLGMSGVLLKKGSYRCRWPSVDIDARRPRLTVDVRWA
jgi:hypothetical protein